MKTRFRLLISLLVLLGGLCAVAAPDDSNVRIDSRVRTIDLEARDGSVVRAKVSDEEVFSTRRGDGRGHMAVLYDDVFSRIVSASAPGTKAIYRAWEPGDLFYSGGRICYLPVQIKSGRSAKATVKSVYDAPEFMSVIYIPEQDYEVGRSEVIVNIPMEVCDKVHITGRNLPAGATETWEETPRGKRYVLRVDSMAGYTGEPNSASASASLPRLLINTRFENLSDFYSYLHSKAGAAEVDTSVKELTESLTQGLDSDLAKADAIATWVRNNIRYVAIEHGEYGHRPDAAAEVLRKRYGDCKGSANLIRSMLCAAGIDGRLVWIGTRGRCAAEWTDLNIAAGNHMIAAAVLPDTTVFLDGTSRFAPAGWVPEGIAGQPCMVENGDDCLLMTVPTNPADANMLTLKMTASLAESGGLSAGGSADFAGSWAQMLENSLADATASRRAGQLSRWLTATGQGLKVASVTKCDSLPRLDFEGLADPTSVRHADGKLYVMPRTLRYLPYEPTTVRGRRNDFDFGTPLCVSSEIELTVPDGYEPTGLPVHRTLSGEWFEGDVSYEVSNDGRGVVCRGKLRPLRTTGTAAEFAAFNEELRRAVALSNTPVVFIKSEI